MKIFDINNQIIEDPDFELGKIEGVEQSVFHTWIVDIPEESHEEVIAYYPETGGKDIAIVVDVEEQGHWETRDENGELVIEFDGFIPDDMPHEQTIQDIWSFQRYILFTEEELKAIADQKEAQRLEEEKRQEREQFLNEAPSRITNAEENIETATTNIQDLSIQSSESATALAELGEIAANAENATSANKDDIAILYQAIAELGAVVCAN